MTRISITDRLQTERPILELMGQEFEVNNTKDAMLAFNEKMQHISENTHGVDIYEEGIRHFLGDAAATQIAEMQLTIKGYEKVFIAIIALAGEETYEEAEARFHKPKTTDKPGMV